MKLIVNDKQEFEWENGQLNAEDVSLDLQADGQGGFHVLVGNRSFDAAVIEADRAQKIFTIAVNGTEYQVQVRDRFDALLEELGMEDMGAARVEDIKAPMPGLVLDIQVEAGQEVAAGDPVVVLEAMIMENVLKAAGPGTVISVEIEKGAAVEKNQLLIKMS